MTSSNAYAIEVQGRSAGIVVADHAGFTFFVADWNFRDLDRRTFRSVPQAERAAKRLAAAHRAVGYDTGATGDFGRHRD